MANNEQIFRDAVNVFGEAAVLDKCIEEAAQLIVALQQYKNGYQDAVTVQGDIAGVLVACGLASHLFGTDGVLSWCDKEIERVSDAVNKARDSAHA